MVHMGLDIDARYPALLCLVGGLLGIIYAQARDEWVRSSWQWPVVAAAVLVPVVSLYQSDTWAQRGQAAQSDDNYLAAAADFAKATSGLVYNPDLITAAGINHYTLSVGLGQMSELDKALVLARKAEDMDTHDAQHWQLEGRVLEQKGDGKGAEAAFRKALELDSLNHPDYALDLASLLVAEKRPDEAVEVAQKMLAQYPMDVVANRSADEAVAPALANLEALIGNVDLGRGDLAGARAAATKALELDRQNLRGRALKHQVDKATAPAQ
jgi:tetratricopeptide (TPR) repeat protein